MTRVVVTRSSDDAEPLLAALREAGMIPVHLPVIATAAADPTPDVDRTISSLAAGAYSWIVFSSANGVKWFGAALERSGVSIPDGTKVAAVGTATAASLTQRGIRVALVPDVHTGTDLAHALGPGAGRVLLPRPEQAPDAVLEALAVQGWVPDEVVVYRTVAGAPDPAAVEQVRHGAFDVLTFTSGSTVRFFAELVARPEALELGDRKVVCIGPSTAEVARGAGFPVDAIARPHTVGGLVEAIATVVGR
ncbi:MAG TPA: uroporphyrinogen-III synthase [Actinomycetota bacterium]|nr:uroporphyrinogen-III synthase [Actinomycetota bacterium]